MSINLDRFQKWAARQVYLLIYEHILEDFMPIPDCKAVHSDGNMLAGESSVTHTRARGGQNTYGKAKRADYRRELEDGSSVLENARETGQTGRLRD